MDLDMTTHRTVNIALVKGDGAAPEIMAVACGVAEQAALIDSIDIKWIDAPMGWRAYESLGDTYPQASVDIAKDCGIIFFGGVGDPALDKTHGKKDPKMLPETRALLGLRKELGLLINVRPLIIPHSLRDMARVRPETIPEEGINQVWMRYLQEDGYFGTRDLLTYVPRHLCEDLGIKLKADVTGNEEMVTELAYYKRSTIETYAKYAFTYARNRRMPVINIHKANILARSLFWKKVIDRIHAEQFSDVPMTDLYIDAAVSMLYEPKTFNAVILCGNEHGDIASDGALGAFSMGMMCSSAVNPENGNAMFESGAGTAPSLAGKDVANPLGRVLTAAMMLRHIGATRGAEKIEQAVNNLLMQGWRTRDIACSVDSPNKIIGTRCMGTLILEQL